MGEWITPAADQLWRNGLAVLPLVVLVAAVTRFVPCRPSTKHLLWVMVLVWLVVPPLVPGVNLKPNVAGEVADQSATSANKIADKIIADEVTGKVARVVSGEVAIPDVGDDAEGFRPRHHVQSLARSVARTPKTLARASVPDGRLRQMVPSVQTVQTVPTVRDGVADHPVPDAATSYAPTFAKVPERGIAGTAERIVISRRRTNRPTIATDSGIAIVAKKDGSLLSPRSQGELRGILETNVDVPDPLVVNSDPKPKDRRSDPSNDRTADVAARGTGEPFVPVAWRVWLASILAVRDAIGRVPVMPANLWIGGVAALGLVCVMRLVAFSLRIRAGAPADRKVRRLVRRVAKRMRVRRVPVVLMVDDRVSPMISCGLWPRLILPRSLWAELDDAGREAVVFHELAHLRRWDHIVAWADTFVGLLYWWHPLVWWVRGRLHAEAEHCCDAWVTTLRPKARRVYAQTLLRTRDYVSRAPRALPAMTIGMTTNGMTSGRAKRFARRLTMVMTNRVKPGLSAPGVGLVLAVAVMGWVASPVQSCPNEKSKCKTKKTELVKARNTYEAHLAAKQTAKEVATQYRLVSDDGDNNVDKRLKRLEKRLEKLMRKLEKTETKHKDKRRKRYRDGPDGSATQRHSEWSEAGPAGMHGHGERRRPGFVGGPGHGPGPGHGGPHGHPDAEARFPHGLRTFTAPEPRHPPHAPRTPRAPRAPRAPHAPRPPRVDAGDMSWRSYELSGEKLAKFTDLMVLNDVPVFVRPGDDSIEIQATDHQHEVLNAFFRMIDPSASRAGSFFAPRHRRAHGSVRTSAGCGSCGAVAVGTEGCRDDCAGCKKLKDAQSVRRLAQEAREVARRELVRVRTELGGKAAELREVAREKARQIRRRVRRQIRELRATAESQEEMLETLHEQMETMHDQGESLRERAQEIRERAEELRERASEESVGAETRAAFERQVLTLVEGAAGLDGNAASMDDLAAMLEGKTGAVEEQIHSLEEYAEQLVGRVSAIDDVQHLIEEGVDGNVTLAERMAVAVGSTACGRGLTTSTTRDAETVAPVKVLGDVRIVMPEVAIDAPEITAVGEVLGASKANGAAAPAEPVTSEAQITAEAARAQVSTDFAKVLEASLAAVEAAVATDPVKGSDPK